MDLHRANLSPLTTDSLFLITLCRIISGFPGVLGLQVEKCLYIEGRGVWWWWLGIQSTISEFRMTYWCLFCHDLAYLPQLVTVGNTVLTESQWCTMAQVATNSVFAADNVGFEFGPSKEPARVLSDEGWKHKTLISVCGHISGSRRPGVSGAVRSACVDSFGANKSAS